MTTIAIPVLAPRAPAAGRFGCRPRPRQTPQAAVIAGAVPDLDDPQIRALPIAALALAFALAGPLAPPGRHAA